MKKIVFLVFFSVFYLISCEKDNKDNPGTIENLQLTKILDYFPVEQYNSSSKAIFVNEQGDEKTLDIELQQFTEDKIIQGIDYTVETITVTYFDSEDASYNMRITVSANYTSPTKSFQFVNAAILTTLNNGYIPTARVQEDGEPILCVRAEEVLLLGKNFLNVYSNFKVSELKINSFSEIYYSPILGIVGFQGFNGTLWVLKNYAN